MTDVFSSVRKTGLPFGAQMSLGFKEPGAGGRPVQSGYGEQGGFFGAADAVTVLLVGVLRLRIVGSGERKWVEVPILRALPSACLAPTTAG